jgi:tetratricopeptide (TPR) repeat protein
MSATLLSSVGDAISLVFQALLALLILGLAALLASASVRSRSALQFEPWKAFNRNGRDEGSTEGERVAELLLAEIRDIQSVHQRSKRGLDLDNPYYDVPAFQQGLDDDLTLLTSVQPQSHGGLAGELMSVVLALVPIRPGRLGGSIHRTGDTATLVASIDNLRHRKRPKIRQWRVAGEVGAEGDLEPLVRELAYHVYLELATASAFNTFEAFRSYTDAVKNHLAFGEDERKTEARGEAAKFYNQALELEPANPAVLYNLGVLKYYLYEAEPNEEAIGLFRSALRSAEGPLKAQVHSGLCNALVQGYHRFDGDRDLLDDARSHGTRALAIDRKLDVALKALAFAYHQSSEALARDGPDKHGRARRREIRRLRNRAIRLYRRTVRVNPRYYVAFNNLANLYLNWAVDDVAGTHERKTKRLLHLAEKLALKSIEVKPSYWHAYDNVGNVYRALGQLGENGRFDEARQYYEDARALRADYLPARHDLALLYLCSDWARSDYRTALRLHHETVAASGTDRERAGYVDAFVRAATAAGLDTEDSQNKTLKSVLPDDLRWRITGSRASLSIPTVS